MEMTLINEKTFFSRRIPYWDLMGEMSVRNPVTGRVLAELLGKRDNDALVRGWGEFQGQREVMTPKASPGNMKICREPFLSNQ